MLAALVFLLQIFGVVALVVGELRDVDVALGLQQVESIGEGGAVVVTAVDLVVDERRAELVLAVREVPAGVLLLLRPGLIVVAGGPRHAAALLTLVAYRWKLARQVGRRSQDRAVVSAGRRWCRRVGGLRRQLETEVMGAVALGGGRAAEEAPQVGARRACSGGHQWDDGGAQQEDQ